MSLWWLRVRWQGAVSMVVEHTPEERAEGELTVAQQIW